MTRCAQTILVVEDEPNDQLFIQMAFRQIGVTGPIHLLNNGEEAIAYMMGEAPYADRRKYAYPTFIMTDLKMPVADGFAVLEHIKANPDWAIIPTVVLSTSTDPDDICTAYRLGASAYHVKPTTFTELRSLLKTLHDYWMTCQIPEVEPCGRHIYTDTQAKLGHRFSQSAPAPLPQIRARH